MYIIRKDANENGSRPALQSWSGDCAPSGYALCPDEFYEVFYSTTPAGFVDIEVSDDTVVSMTVRKDDVDAWNEEHPTANDPDVESPSQLDRIEAQVTYTAMMTDTLLEEE